jgi:hypothetical protein
MADYRDYAAEEANARRKAELAGDGWKECWYDHRGFVVCLFCGCVIEMKEQHRKKCNA